jgi:gentisate 1,2-dioxygenase
MNEIQKKRADFHERLRSKELLEGYSYDDGHDFVTRPYWPHEPRNKMKPHLWKWSEIRPLVQECGDMVALGHGGGKYDRRVLALSNPGAGGDFTLTGPLFGDIQLIRPGEAAPCHRHTPCATRFILEGTGGWTTVNGDRVRLKPGDVVYTGQFPWHDHGNDGPDDFIFLDVLDIPLLFFTGASSWEFNYEAVTGSKTSVNQPAMVTDHHLPTSPNLRPAFGTSWKRNADDLVHLPWTEARPALRALVEEKGSPFDGIRLELKGAGGGPVGRTVSVHTQLIRAREKTGSHRHTGAFVYVCAEGRGSVNIEKETFEFERNDIFVIPSWHWHSFESTEGCVMHSISDLSLLSKLNLYREQSAGGNGEPCDTGWTSDTEAGAQ